MGDFHSYVSLPDGSIHYNPMEKYHYNPIMIPGLCFLFTMVCRFSLFIIGFIGIIYI